MSRSWIRALVVSVTLVGVAAPAAAQLRPGDRVTSEKLTLGASLGYGFRITDDGNFDNDPNPYGIGLGARAGYTLDAGLYLGGLFNYFWGDRAGGDSVNARINQVTLGGDVGYDIPLGDRAVLRPVLGIGATIVMGEICVLGSCADDQSDPYLLLAPGVVLVIALGDLYLGAEARYFYLPDDAFPDGLLLGGNIGALL